MEGSPSNEADNQYQQFILNDSEILDVNYVDDILQEEEIEKEDKTANSCPQCKSCTCTCDKMDQIYTPERSLLEEGELIESPEKNLTDNDETKIDVFVNKALQNKQTKPRPLLGRVQAQRRLQAFSIQKKNVLTKISPLLLKSKLRKEANEKKQLIQSEEKNLDEPLRKTSKASRRLDISPIRLDRSKSVISEIEPLHERLEPRHSRIHPYSEKYEKSQRQMHPRFLFSENPRYSVNNYKYGEERRFEHRRGSRGKYFTERRSRPTVRDRYELQPKNWTEYKKYFNGQETYQRRNEPITHKFAMRLLLTHSFEENDYFLNGTFFVAKSLQQDNYFRQKFYYHETLKRTEIEPRVSYCETLKHCTNLFPTREQFYQLIPRKRADLIKEFLKKCPSDTKNYAPPLNVKSKGWYPKSIELLSRKKSKTPPSTDIIQIVDSDTEIATKPTPKSYGLAVLSENYQNQFESGSDHDEDSVEQKLTLEDLHEDLTPVKLGELTPVEPDTCDEMVDTPEKTPNNTPPLPEPVVTNPVLLEKEILAEIEDPPIEKKVQKEGKLDVKKIETDVKVDEARTPPIQTPNTDEYRSNWEDEEEYLAEFKSPNVENTQVWDSDDNNSILSRKASKRFNRYANKKDLNLADISYNEKQDTNLTNGLSDSFINSFGYRRSASRSDKEEKKLKKKRLKKSKKSKSRSKRSKEQSEESRTSHKDEDKKFSKLNLSYLEEELEHKRLLLRRNKIRYDDRPDSDLDLPEGNVPTSYWDYDDDTENIKVNRREDMWENNRYWNNSYDINEFRMKEKIQCSEDHEKLSVSSVVVVNKEKSSSRDETSRTSSKRKRSITPEVVKTVQVRKETDVSEPKIVIETNPDGSNKLVSEYEEFMKTVGFELAEVENEDTKSKVLEKSDRMSIKSDKSIKSNKSSEKSETSSKVSKKSSKRSKRSKKSKKRKKRNSSDESDIEKKSSKKKKLRKAKKLKKKRKKSTSSSSAISSSSSSSDSNSETTTTTSNDSFQLIAPSKIKLEKLSDEEPQTIITEPIIKIKMEQDFEINITEVKTVGEELPAPVPPPAFESLDNDCTKSLDQQPISSQPNNFFDTFNLNTENSTFELEDQVIDSVQPPELDNISSTITLTLSSSRQNLINVGKESPAEVDFTDLLLKRNREPDEEPMEVKKVCDRDISKSPTRYSSKSSSSSSRRRLSPSEYERYRRDDYKYERSRASDRSRSDRERYSRRHHDDKHYDKYSRRSRWSRSPLYKNREYSSNSPLDFKRSVADSTISDSELIQSINHEPPPPGTESYKKGDRLSELKRTSSSSPSVDSPNSPKRLSLDDRINQFLGIDDKKPAPKVEKREPTNYAYNDYQMSNNYYDQRGYPPMQNNYQHQYDQNAYHQQNYYNPPPPTVPAVPPQRYPQHSQVLQVGNVLQVVPTEIPSMAYPPPSNKEDNTKSKIVQVGNMLQIVPTENLPELPKVITPPKPTPAKIKPTPPAKASPILPPPKKDIVKEYIRETSLLIKDGDKKSTIDLVNELVVKQRKLDKEKRLTEKEQRRKVREFKRAEKEKRKEQRIKLKTEKMIKRALLLDAPGNIDSAIIDISEIVEATENEEDESFPTVSTATTMWPPPLPLPVPLEPPTKGILVRSGFSKLKTEIESEIEDQIATSPDEKPKNLKSVRFADGIPPGEGTSPSGGEDLPSPPPPKRKLPKEERYKKTKIRSRKKVKVKVIRPVIATPIIEEDDSDDNLPPPPPPPGSPPPHLWPANYNKPPPPIETPAYGVGFPNATHIPPPGFPGMIPPSPGPLMPSSPMIGTPGSMLPLPSNQLLHSMIPSSKPSLLPPPMLPPSPNMLKNLVPPIPPNYVQRPPLPMFPPDNQMNMNAPPPIPYGKMYVPDRRRHYPIT